MTKQTRLEGADNVHGLADAIRVEPATTYDATNVLGFRILAVGSGDLTYINEGSGATVVIANAELTVGDYPIKCTSVTTGAGMLVLAYVPDPLATPAP